MSAIHFTVPGEASEVFNAAFADQDKNAVITELILKLRGFFISLRYQVVAESSYIDFP
jgi:hypothetical protein